MSNQWDAYEEEAKSETGGGGIISKVRLTTGFKIFVSGYKNDSNFFPFTLGDEKSQAKALSAAKAITDEHGAKEPRKATRYEMLKETVKGREVTWQGNRIYDYPWWTDAWQGDAKKGTEAKFRGGVKGALIALGLDPVGEYWLKTSWTEDPSGRKEKDQHGDEKTALIAYPVARYNSEADAEAGVESNGESASKEPEFDPGEWTKALSEIEKAIKDKTKELKSPAKALEFVLGEYQLTAENLTAIRAAAK